MDFKTICTFDVLDDHGDFDYIELQVMSKDGTFSKIYELELDSFITENSISSRIFKIGMNKKRKVLEVR